MIIIEDLEKAAKPEQLADDSNVVKKQKLNLEKLENDLDVDANLLCLTTKSDDLYKMKKFLTEADSLKKSSKRRKKEVCW